MSSSTKSVKCSLKLEKCCQDGPLTRLSLKSRKTSVLLGQKGLQKILKGSWRGSHQWIARYRLSRIPLKKARTTSMSLFKFLTKFQLQIKKNKYQSKLITNKATKLIELSELFNNPKIWQYTDRSWQTSKDNTSSSANLKEKQLNLFKKMQIWHSALLHLLNKININQLPCKANKLTKIMILKTCRINY